MKKQKTVSMGEGHYHEMTTLDLIRAWIISKLPVKKESFQVQDNSPKPPPSNVSVNNIAVVLDGIVEETIQCQNRLAALLLSEPKFIEYEPNEVQVSIGYTEYTDGVFINQEEPLMTDEEIAKTLKNMESKDGNSK